VSCQQCERNVRSSTDHGAKNKNKNKKMAQLYTHSLLTRHDFGQENEQRLSTEHELKERSVRGNVNHSVQITPSRQLSSSSGVSSLAGTWRAPSHFSLSNTLCLPWASSIIEYCNKCWTIWHQVLARSGLTWRTRQAGLKTCLIRKLG
jgi:hypothetical protein